jgi:hypothetical protein
MILDFLGDEEIGRQKSAKRREFGIHDGRIG